MQRGLHSVRCVDMQQHRRLHSGDMRSQGEVLDSEHMHIAEGEGLEQGQCGLCGDVMLGVGGYGHVLWLQAWVYAEEQRLYAQCVQLSRWHAKCRDRHWWHLV